MDRKYDVHGGDINTTVKLDSDIRSPVYEDRIEYRESSIPPSATLLLKVTLGWGQDPYSVWWSTSKSQGHLSLRLGTLECIPGKSWYTVLHDCFQNFANIITYTGPRAKITIGGSKPNSSQ